MQKNPVKNLVIWGIVCLALSVIISLVIQNNAPKTQMGALLPGLIQGLLALGFIVLEIIAIVNAIINKKNIK